MEFQNGTINRPSLTEKTNKFPVWSQNIKYPVKT